LQVLDESYSSLGFVSKEYNKYGEYGVLTNNSADYLSISLDMDETSSKNGHMSTIVSPYTPALAIHPSCIILGQNGPLAAYPFFGAIVGFNSTSNDLGQGNYESGRSHILWTLLTRLLVILSSAGLFSGLRELLLFKEATRLPMLPVYQD
jgi:hypothetical protein